MSLLKANDLVVSNSYNKVKTDFLDVVNSIVGVPVRTDCVVLVRLYTDYSIIYLADISQTLDEPKGVNQTMKYMYSYIAEIFTACDLKLFHKTDGYTIVDKTIQEALDNKGTITYEYIDKVITDIQNSYVEDVTIEAEDDSSN